MRAYLAKNSCSPRFWSKLAIYLRTGCLFPPLRRKLKLSQPQFADARDSRARTGLFRFRRRISDLQSSVFACARALPTTVSVRLKYMQDEFIAAADLPDVVDFAPDSLLPRWLAQLAERGDDLSADAQRDLLRHYVAACPARTSLALIKAKQRDASAPQPHGLSADEVTARGDFSPGLVRYVLSDSTASPSGCRQDLP